MADATYAALVDFAHLQQFKQKCDALYATKATVSALDDRVTALETTAGQPNVIEIVKVNGTPLTPDASKAVDVSVPTTVAELTDASDYAKVVDIPTNNNQLTNGAGYQTASDVQTAIAGKANSADLGTAAAKDFETTLTDGANLPTGAAVTAYVTGLGYQTAAQVTGAIEAYGYQNASDVSTAISDALANDGDAYQTVSEVQASINSALTSAMTYKGTKATKAELPSSDNKVGDLWHVTADGGEYAWDGSEWQEMGSIIDLSNYVTFDDITLVTNDQINSLFE